MSHRENLHESIMAKVKAYENFFMRRLADIKGWTTEKPNSSGFYFVRADSAAEPAVHCYLVNKWHPFEHNTVLNEMVPAGDAVEYLGPFSAENYIDYVSAFCSSMEPKEKEVQCLGVDLGREDTNITCNVCETPIEFGEQICSDGQGGHWHKGCDGEGGCDES
ncbi:hypothetical protein [Maridesulfovibrio sp.]|uniref:hypothetical protein n=1 Tax=Maridesulfovibrio sp. TaxID=2795000 RepID=UPI0029CA7729|nr:hypothetical protein [Maridesulfovibrio sp.]